MTGTLRNLHSPPFCSVGCLLFHRVSVQRRDRRTIIIFPCEFLRSHSVSVQRRDRSLFFLLHCSTKVRLYLITLIYLVIFASFQDFFSQPVYSVSVQRRGRYSVSHFDLARPLCFPLLFSVFTVCLSKDVTGTLFLILIFRKTPSVLRCLFSGYTVYLSKDVTGALSPSPLTPLLTPFPPPFFVKDLVTSFANRLERLLSLFSPSLLGSLSQRYGFICPKTWQVLPPFPNLS